MIDVGVAVTLLEILGLFTCVVAVVLVGFIVLVVVNLLKGDHR